MKFRDNVERDPEDYGFIILTDKEVDLLLKKRKEDPNYKSSLELVQEFKNQKPVAYTYKLKLKDLDIGEGFYTDNYNYVCNRVE